MFRKLVNQLRWSQNEAEDLLKWNNRGISGTSQDIKHKKRSWYSFISIIIVCCSPVIYVCIVLDDVYAIKIRTVDLNAHWQQIADKLKAIIAL